MKEAVSASWEGFDPLPLLQMVSTVYRHSTITNNNLSPVQMVAQSSLSTTTVQTWNTVGVMMTAVLVILVVVVDN